MDEYTPGQVWSVLVGASDDPEAALDVWSAWGQLPRDQATFIYALALGWPGSRVMKTLGLKGNQTRLKREVLERMTRMLNGAEDSTSRRVKDE